MKTKVLSFLLAVLMTCSGIMPGTSMNVPAKANTDRVTATPTSGVFLDEEVVAQFDVTDATYVLNWQNNPASKDMVMAAKGVDSYYDYVYIQETTKQSWYADGWGSGTGTTKGYMKVVIPASEVPADYDHVRINVNLVEGQALPTGTAHVVGTALTADTYDAVTWNTVTNAGVLGAESAISVFGDAGTTASFDVTDIIKEAIAAGRETISIVITPSQAWKVLWNSGRADATKTPVLQFMKAQKVMMLGDVRYLDTTDASGREISYVSSNPNVVSVSDGATLKAVATGNAEITVTSSEGSHVFLVSVEEEQTNEDMKLLIQRTKNTYLNKYTNANTIKTLSDNAEALLDTMYEVGKGNSEGYLWDLGTVTDYTYPVHHHMGNLLTITYAFMTEGTTIYQDPEIGRLILSAMDYITCTGDYAALDYPWSYDGEFPYSGNWWNFCIGVSKNYSRILLMMEPYMDDSKAQEYVDVLMTYIGDPTKCTGETGNQWSAEGSNSSEMIQAYLIAGVAVRDDNMMYRLMQSDCLPKLLEVKNDRTDRYWYDGAYKDGTYLYHHYLAQPLSYGILQVSGVINYLNIFGGTKYDFDKEMLDAFRLWVLDAYLPIFYKGEGMDMMGGRGVSGNVFSPSNDYEQAKGFFYSSNILLRLADTADEEYKATVKSAIKWNLEGMAAYYGKDIVSGDSRARSLLADSTVVAKQYLKGTKVYGVSTRVVQAADRYTAALQMINNRSASYEGGSSEDSTGFYRGAGQLWIYNNDLDQYGYYYWPTYDPYRLVGVTADTTELPIGAGSSTVSEKRIASGATDGTQAAIAFDFSANYVGLDTKAKKSYFFLEEGVLHMGTEISGNTNKTIETTVEARMLKDDGSNQVLINGKVFDGTKTTMNLEAGSWIHLEGNVEGADMAYYFPAATSIEIAKEYCTGS